MWENRETHVLVKQLPAAIQDYLVLLLTLQASGHMKSGVD